jgi:pyridoxine 4-dehydrogenase
MNQNETFTIGGDLDVRRFGYGAMRITGPGIWGPPAPPAPPAPPLPPENPGAARELLKHVVQSGVNLIDTADSYGPEVSENLIAEALYPYPDDLVIATKGGLTRPGPGQWERNCRPERLKRCCEDSLRRLKLERIDVYQLHAVDPKVPIEDSISALAELRDEGKIRHAAVCNVTVEELDRARQIVEVVSVQNRYNIADRASEDVLEVCERDGLAFLPWFPLATGDLAKPGGPLDSVARKHSASPAQVALAWLLHHSPVMLPIAGTSSIAHFDENLEASELPLDEDDLAALEDAAAAASS